MTEPKTPAEALARRFHEAYERLAPSFGYQTRRESAVPWDEVPEQNRRLMIAVAEEVMAEATGYAQANAILADSKPAENERLREALRDVYALLPADRARLVRSDIDALLNEADHE